jgi:hypothetical protein
MAKVQMSARLEPAMVREVQKVLGLRTTTDVVERSLRAMLELARHRRMIRRFSGTGRPDDFQAS